METIERVHPSVKIGKGTVVSSTAIIEEGCVIGKRCFIGHNVVMRPRTIIGNKTVIGHLTVFEGECIVGNECLIHAQCHITKGAVIEDKVFIAPGFVGCNDNDMLHMRRHLKEFVPNGYHIGRGARLGAGVLVLPGVKIGQNSVIGVGSIVTKNVPPFSKVYGKSPARIIGLVDQKEII